jgi:hypothetical protein
MRVMALMLAVWFLLAGTDSQSTERQSGTQAQTANEFSRRAISTPTEIEMNNGARVLMQYEMSVIDDAVLLTEHWRSVRTAKDALPGSEKIITRLLSIDLLALNHTSVAGRELMLSCNEAVACVKGLRSETRECPIGKEICLRTSTMERETLQSLVLVLADERAARNAAVAFNILQRIHNVPDVETPVDFVTRLYRDDMALPNKGLDLAASSLAALLQARLASNAAATPSLEWALQDEGDAPIEGFRVLELDEQTAAATVYVTFIKNGEARDKSVSLALEGERWLISDVCSAQGCFSQTLQE